MCIRRETIFGMVAGAALLLCSPSLVIFAAASRPSTSGRRTSACFVSPSARCSFVGDSLNPSLSTQREASRLPPEPSTLDSTWSNAVRRKESDSKDSKFGVRNRVRSVLDKAKKRTGIENSSVEINNSKRINGEALKSYDFVQSGLNVIAETASLGGLDLGTEREGSDGVVLDYISRKGQPPGQQYNNTTQSAATTKLGEKINGASAQNGGVSGASIKNNAKASPQPSSAPTAFQRPEDKFVLSSDSEENSTIDTSTRQKPLSFTEKEAFTGDVSAAFSIPREPLPFELPTLDREQYRQLMNGERVQFQDDMGRAGSGYVVWDVKAPASVVWDCLLDFQSYPQTITTVREVVMYTNTHLKEDYRAERPLDFEDGTAAICQHGVPSVTRAQFSLSKFRLKIAAVHKYRPHPKGDYMIFTLDPASRNPVLKYAKGIWHTQSDPDGKEGHTRVWLLCELRVSRLLPQWIVDYAAARAMPRATTWLKPMTEAAARLWLKDSTKR